MDKWSHSGLSRDMQNFHRTMEEQTQSSVRALERARAQQRRLAQNAPHGSVAGSSSGRGGSEVLAGMIGLVAGIWIFVQLSVSPVGALICAIIGGVIVSLIARIILNNVMWVLIIGGGLLLLRF